MGRALGQVQFQYLLAQARVRLGTRAYVVALVIQVVLLVPLAQCWGPAGLAVAGLVSTTAWAFAQALLLRRHFGSSLVPFLVTLGWMLAALLALFAMCE